MFELVYHSLLQHTLLPNYLFACLFVGFFELITRGHSDIVQHCLQRCTQFWEQAVFGLMWANRYEQRNRSVLRTEQCFLTMLILSASINALSSLGLLWVWEIESTKFKQNNCRRGQDQELIKSVPESIWYWSEFLQERDLKKSPTHSCKATYKSKVFEHMAFSLHFILVYPLLGIASQGCSLC